MTTPPTPTAGDRVGVPWGLDVLEGVVIRTYRTGNETRAVVSVDVPGTDEEPQVVTLRTADLLPVGEGHELAPPGSWVSDYQFTKEVQAALARAVKRIGRQAEVETEPRLGGRRADAIVRYRDHLLVIEVKTSANVANAVSQLTSFLGEVRDRNPDASVRGVLVLRSEPEDQAIRELASQGATAVSWNTPRDDSKLASELTRLLRAA